jgi:hypothetical protein
LMQDFSFSRGERIVTTKPLRLYAVGASVFIIANGF